MPQAAVGQLQPNIGVVANVTYNVSMPQAAVGQLQQADVLEDVKKMFQCRKRQ